MKKLVFLVLMLVVASTAIKAQLNYATVNVTNATLIQPAGNYLYYGDMVMNKKQCINFLKERHQPAYEKFQSGYKCYQAGWGLAGAALGCELAGSLLVAFAEDDNNMAMEISGDAFIIAGCCALIAAVPTLYIGYSRLNQGIDMFNMSQVQSAPRAYWTIQGSENGLGIALHF